MKMVAYSTLLFYTLLGFSQSNQDQLNHEEWPAQTLVHYTKSNWDGSNRGYISIYFKEDGWIESVKWHEGVSTVSIIPAKIDQTTGSVLHFKNIRCQGGECIQRGEMVRNANTGDYIINFGELTDTIQDIPDYWHSYDFDWASLLAAFLFKKDHASHEFERCDFFMDEGLPKFGPYGKIIMFYQGVASKENRACHVYSIDGPGLNDNGGEIWFDQRSSLLMGFKIKEPDEDSYEDVEFTFIGQENMQSEQWDQFKKSKWSE